MDSFDLTKALLIFITSTNGVIIIGMAFIIYMGNKVLKACRQQEKLTGNMGEPNV